MFTKWPEIQSTSIERSSSTCDLVAHPLNNFSQAEIIRRGLSYDTTDHMDQAI